MHPFVFYPWSLGAFKRRPVFHIPATAPSGRPTLTICMSAYNEEAVIREKAASLIAMADAYGPVEIFVYVDGPQDRTLELLSAYRDRIRIFSSTERRGKTAGLKLLVSSSSSELIAFTDANVISSSDCLIGLELALRDPTVGCASARLVYTNAEESETSRGGAEYWNREELIKERESNTIGMIGVDGSLFMIRRDIYEFPPDDIIDDLYTSLIVLLKGYHVVSVPNVVVFERNATSVREEFHRKARISCQGINVHRLLWPRLRKMPLKPLYGYISHRLLKWLVPYFLLSAPIFALAGIVEIFGLLATFSYLLALVALFAIGLVIRVPILLRLTSYFLLIVGVGRGVFEAVVLGHRYTTWSPATSVRTT
jgi:cellulose synthase/poly-beta-1,6-N-acetylglucosamine synthase-like glycosyltransferase